MQNNRQQPIVSKNFIFWTFLLFVTLLIVWKTQDAVPVMMDDTWYSTVLRDETPLQSWRDIVDAQLWHYHNWGGRTVAHTILQIILLYLSESAADLLNVCMILLLAWTINCIAGTKRISYLTLTIGCLHGLNANWKMSMYWQTGACNYLYTTAIIFIFLYLYLRRLDAENSKDVPALTMLAAPLGLLTGWTNENMGPTAWLISLAVIILLWRQKQPIRPWMAVGNLCCLIGSVLMIAAPGNAVRSAQTSVGEHGMLWKLFLQVYSVCKGAWEYLFPVLVITAFLIFINVFLLGNKLRQKELVLLGCALASWGAMVLSPHYPDRAAFGTMALLLCVILSQAASICKTKNSRSCTLMMTGIGIFVWLRGMYYLGEFLSITWGWIR